jgi:hypothetical protein
MHQHPLEGLAVSAGGGKPARFNNTGQFFLLDRLPFIDAGAAAGTEKCEQLSRGNDMISRLKVFVFRRRKTRYLNSVLRANRLAVAALVAVVGNDLYFIICASQILPDADFNAPFTQRAYVVINDIHRHGPH